MKKHNDSFYYEIVKSAHPAVHTVQQPVVRGSNKVMIAETTDEKLVFKFTAAEIARRNEQIGIELHRSALPVPKSSVATHNIYHFEVYPYIQGKTLFQRVGEGMNFSKINNVYEEMIDLVNSMSEIATASFDTIDFKYFHDITRANLARTSNPIVGNIVSTAVRFMNSGEQGIYHFGLTPKNILLDNNDKLIALLDLDEVAIGNENYMFGTMLEAYKRLGGNAKYLFDAYERITNNHLDRSRVNAQVNTIAAGKKMLYKLSQAFKGK